MVWVMPVVLVVLAWISQSSHALARDGPLTLPWISAYPQLPRVVVPAGQLPLMLCLVFSLHC